VVKKIRGSKLRAKAPERPLHHRQLGCECRVVAHSDREEGDGEGMGRRDGGEREVGREAEPARVRVME
jgi:hypothetical protein